MRFRDQCHIDQVRDALWKRNGGASVMIGSGFSRNARKIRPDAEDPPTWGKVGRAIHNKLYPQRDVGDRGDDILQTPGTDNILRLAQEYEAAFGRPDLNRFLRQLIRDEDYKPVDAHLRLLRLPWRDVFTTNWDTLLERASDSVVECNYSVVRTMNEIPLAFEQRIVKLHGSFPDYFPLIVTEEDYRTYPAKFAPFVNTAQQAMMETVFCLIGFSGDDTNFLRWSGWVRDNLGDAAPTIYLAGWLGLSTHRRRMLEDHNVVPIDLAHHPQANKWQDHLRHDFAIDWILYTLERGRPYDVTTWPSSKSHKYPSIPDDLQPVHELVSEVPKKEPMDQPDIDDEDLPEKASQTLGIWTHNRTIYPNWLILPASARQSLSLGTNSWEPAILHVLPRFGFVDGLKAIRELVWRRETLLEPISAELESAAEGILLKVDCKSRTVDGVLPDPEIDWSTIREAGRSVGLTLVTAARHRFDHELFNQRIETLLSIHDAEPDVFNRVHHERCLWAIYSFEFNELEDLLNDWQTENCDPAWMMRKAALLFETGRDSEAADLTKDALTSIRKTPYDGRSLAGPSREGWALFLSNQLDNWRSFWGNWHALRRRWDELTPLECNAAVEKRHIADSIKGNPETRKARPFDLNIRTIPGLRISNAKPRAAAYRAVRLTEIAGLPPSVPGVAVASDILKMAADELSVLEPEMAARLAVRASDYDRDDTLMRVLSRTRVAALPVDVAKTLAKICNGVINYAHPRMFKAGKYPRNVFWIERMRVASEVLSRLVLRLETDSVETIFNKALELYRNHQVAQEPWLTDPVRNMLMRSWEALTEDRRTTHILDVFGAPILGMDNFTSDWPRYPEPAVLLEAVLELPVRTDENEGRWQEIVSLLVRALHSGGEPRRRASLRIASADSWKQLNESEAERIAQALWSEKYTRPNGLPRETDLFDWVFLLLPEPTPGLSEQNFRRKWLLVSSLSQENRPSLDDILWQVGKAIAGLKTHGSSLTISDDEQSYLIEVVKQWSDNAVPSYPVPYFENQLREPTRQAIDGLRSIIAEIPIPEDIGERLYKKVQKLNESGIPAFGLIAGLLKTIPNRFDEIALLMRTGLASESEDLKKNALQGLSFWLEMTTEPISQLREPPEDFVREVGIMIAARRKDTLALALQIAKWVFDEGNDAQKEAISHLALQGLGYLLEELRYDREHDPHYEDEIPLLRWRSAELAVSMSSNGYGDDPSIFRWLEVAEEDPMPEVRYVKDPPYFRRPDSEETDSNDDDAPG